ncbi:MAG: translational GTPase TypA [Gammaproteobacteria bacterium]
MKTTHLRNIAIIAHVDHGKTTLVDKILQQTHALGRNQQHQHLVMDSNDIERERGITILAKTTAIQWEDYRINIVDTPGHADFGGEVERILSMVDSVLLLVDAAEGPMPQTRFVTQKAFAQGLHPIVVINKVDKLGARPHWAMDQVFELFDSLDATDEQLDFPVIYTSALQGFATLDLETPSDSMVPLLKTIVDRVPPPPVDLEGPFQMQISSLDYSSYTGAMGIGRISRGTIKSNSPITLIDREGKTRSARILQIFTHLGLERVETPEAQAGDIVVVTGIETPQISDTLCDPSCVEALPSLTVDEPTISMIFQVNSSPFAGKSGKYITSRHLRDRLERETLHNVALRVSETEDPDKFNVAGRGTLHLTVLIENMRREGYELAVSCPHVIYKEDNGQTLEPYELLQMDVEENHQGTIMENLGTRGGDLQNMIADGKGRVRLEYMIPSRSLIGFHSEFISQTSGTGLINHTFDHYGPMKTKKTTMRQQGVLIANGSGNTTGFALFNLQQRGRLFVGPGEPTYEGMIVGLHIRDNDLVVNVNKTKQLTNIRASGTDESIILTPPTRMSLEQALEFIAEDELVEITPDAMRLRKKFLKEVDRKRSQR